MSNAPLITRKDYMAGHASNPNLHREYYGQFVTGYVRSLVVDLSMRSLEAMQEGDRFVDAQNRIPLKDWDARTAMIPNHTLQLIARADPCGPTLSDKGCVLRTSADQVMEQLLAQGFQTGDYQRVANGDKTFSIT